MHHAARWNLKKWTTSMHAEDLGPGTEAYRSSGFVNVVCRQGGRLSLTRSLIIVTHTSRRIDSSRSLHPSAAA